LEVANYLALTEVVKRCSDHMLANMDQENALEVLAVADTLGLAKLKSKAKAYICTIFQVAVESINIIQYR
jgi:hypothetical protein